MQEPYLNKVRNYVLSLLTTRTRVENFYHDVTHTNEVVQSAIEIGIGEKLSEDELEMVQIAAWFHDVGYIEKTDGHEEVGIQYARKFLTGEQYPTNKIEIISGCILATRVPQKPINKLEKILCDADLFHLHHVYERTVDDHARVQQAEQHGDDGYDAAHLRGENLDQRIHADMRPDTHAVRDADEDHEGEQDGGEFLRPGESGIEHIAHDDLRKSKQRHRRQQNGDQPFVQSFQ